MGLFVVGKLAARHSIRVRLRQQRGDFGITASVLLPPCLVSEDTSDTSVEPPDSSPPAFDGAFGTAWSGTNAELPLRVCVVEGATDPDQLSPSSIGGLMTVRRRRPRTAEEEWFELFGHEEPAHEQIRTPPSGSVADVPESGSVAGVPQQTGEEIFKSVSAWFQAGRPAVPPVPTARAWQSAGDDGWSAAKVLRTRVDFEVTDAGLPRRQPGAQLMPGSAGPSRPGPAPGSNISARTAEDVRGRLSSYQRGLRHGRHSRVGLGDRLARTPARQGYSDEDSRHPEEDS